MVVIFGYGGAFHVLVSEDNRLWFPGSAGGEVEPAHIMVIQFYSYWLGRCLSNNIFEIIHAPWQVMPDKYIVFYKW